MNQDFEGVTIPDSRIAVEAAEILRQFGDELLWNHSHRVYLFGAILGKYSGMKYDPELLYVSALFHDLGLTKAFSSPNLRFEVDGANAAREFLTQHGVPEASVKIVWDAVALHTTIGIAEHKEAEVALINSGVGYDVIGKQFEALSPDLRERIVTAYPRNQFKQRILHAFLDGFKHKPETTFGNIKSDVCERLIPGYQRTNFCDCVLHSKWAD